MGSALPSACRFLLGWSDQTQASVLDPPSTSENGPKSKQSLPAPRKRGLNMTMILTCLTKDFIVQASDRRLSIVDGNNVRPREDHSNKALIYSNCFVFAYTGLAKLDSQSASAIDWAAQQLSEKENIGESVLHLGNRASDLMNSSYSHLSADKKRLTFVGAGFANVDR